jgi:Protein of unknown function (DUF1688)
MVISYREWEMQAIASMAHDKNLAAAEVEAIAYLRSPKAIRERCGRLFELACQDQLHHFRCDLNRLESVADYVIQVIRSTYPNLNIPLHSRWRHFEEGGLARLAYLDAQLQDLTLLEKVRTKFDLVITSVLLDAGAGAEWQYEEPGTGRICHRSEGLAIASFHMFLQGLFSSHPDRPFQADAEGLQELTESKLSQGFQINAHNPMIGLQGRLRLLQTLGWVLRQYPDLFGDKQPRLGHLVDYLLQQAKGNHLAAPMVLQAVLEGLSDIWTGRVAIANINLGDVWTHTALSPSGLGGQLVPFHKLSQWLTYSLLEPLQELGLEITQLNELTGLAEYRNGGLCFDLGLLHPKHPDVIGDPHLPSSEVIVEWRALTVSLLDQIAIAIRQKLGMDEIDLPLIKVLEGGTWKAGRKIAAELREEGIPPIQMISDGTVF